MVLLMFSLDLVLEVEDSLTVGSHIIVNENALLSQMEEDHTEKTETNSNALHSSLKNSNQNITVGKL